MNESVRVSSMIKHYDWIRLKTSLHSLFIYAMYKWSLFYKIKPS